MSNVDRERLPNARRRFTARSSIAAASVLALVMACTTSGPAWVAHEGQDVAVSADGLVGVRFSGFARTWLKPNEHFSAYSSLWIASPAVAFKRQPTARDGSVDLTVPRNSDPNFPLDERQLGEFKGYLVDSFRAELDRSREFRVVDAPGPDTLIVVPSVVDLVMLVPLGQLPGGDFVFTTATAQLTLILELRDPSSGAVLARVIERRVASPPGSNGLTTGYASSPLENVSALRKTFRDWARTLRYRLDATRALAGEKAAGDSRS